MLLRKGQEVALTAVLAALLLTAATPSAGSAVVSGRCLGCKGIPFNLGELHFVSPAEGWSSAWYWPPGNGSGYSTLLHTTDGGRHWRRLPFVWQAGAEAGPPFSFADRNHGWVAWTKPQTGDSFLSTTSDGGRTWKHHPSPRLSALHFFDAKHGYSIDGTFFRTTADGGETWSREALPLSIVDRVSFADARHGVIVGAGGVPEQKPKWDGVLRVLVTSDGGAHWTVAEEQPYAEPHAVEWIDSRTAFLVLARMNDSGTRLLVTNDGGQSWKASPGERKDISAIAMAPDGRGFLFGEKTISATADRGATWRVSSFPYAVTDCQFFNGKMRCSAGMKLLELNPPAAAP